MKTLLVFTVMAASSMTYAVSDCKAVDGSAYLGTITAESREISYKGCPSDILINDEYVSDLERVKEVNGDVVCAYEMKNNVIYCKK
ncbi:MAG: hypothetical protein KC478_01925 [Bacteriovoracaceae bacterium]|nr:hypothetical protein [Bacteriovoracaceae bacterium]